MNCKCKYWKLCNSYRVEYQIEDRKHCKYGDSKAECYIREQFKKLNLNWSDLKQVTKVIDNSGINGSLELAGFLMIFHNKQGFLVVCRNCKPFKQILIGNYRKSLKDALLNIKDNDTKKTTTELYFDILKTYQNNNKQYFYDTTII